MYKVIIMNKQIDIEELLDWYIFAGVTETCGDLPCLNNQPLVLDDNKKLLQQSVKTQKIPVSLSENISRNAKDICSKASSLEELKEQLK